MMRKILYTIIVVCVLTGCEKDLTDYFDRLDMLESDNDSQRDKNAELEKQLALLDSLNDLIIQKQADQARWNEELEELIREREAYLSLQGQQVHQQDSLIGILGEDIDREKETGYNLIDSTALQTEVNGTMMLTWEALQQKLDSLERVVEASVKPRLLSMEFAPANNPTLKERVVCEINSDNTIDCWLPNVDTNKILVPSFKFDGTMVTISAVEAQSGVSQFDFSKPLILAVATSVKIEWYKVYVHAYTGLPVMYINTAGGREVTSKDYYIDATIRLVEDVKTRAAGDVIEEPVHIKGRGNSSWQQPKKPYRLKFDKKVEMLGVHADKSWVLLANYSDKSMLRNSLAFYMSSISNLDYTPKSHFVELVMNGMFQGTYLLCEKVKVSNHRVAVGDDGFLIEIDARAPQENENPYFRLNHVENEVVIREPEVSYNDANYNYIYDYMWQCENALYGSNFKDTSVGWQKYMDIDSFVDWYLIQEIGKNLDGLFWSSCFLSLKRGEKLKMGPIWDMDIAYGNIHQANQSCYNPEGFYIRNVKWFYRLYRDPAFVKRLKERFNYFYENRYEILRNINADAQYLKYSVVENEQIWKTLYHYTWSNHDIWGSYQNEVQDLKTWFIKRMDWMKKQYDEM